ncbi:fatty acid-binding protein-like [Oppia nitens]|uniref:fatty acid-binding protein-like n=1 Tax=Oppia nitens TaxID=1686743 RepID=UPI0023DB2A2D|nr:fatty acid-binding protein-like [Oppia nitens]
MSDFTGKYKLQSATNTEAFLKELGLPDEFVAKAKDVKPELEISLTGDEYTIKTVTPNRTHEIKFKLGEEFDDQLPDGRKFKTTVTIEGNKLTQVNRGDTKTVTFVRELNGDELNVTGTVGSVTTVGVYARQ